MIAVASFFASPNSLVLFERILGEPFRTTTVFLSSFCEPFFFFLSRKKEEKCEN